MSEKEILRGLVAIDSQFPKERRIGEHIERLLRSNGFRTQRQYGYMDRFNVFAEKGREGKALLLYGHLDTVPLYGTWKTDPFKLTERGDRLYGLGTRDMKGGCAAIIEAALRTRRHVKLLFGFDEENISEGAWISVQKRRRWFRDVKMVIAADAGVTDANEGGVGVVTLGRRGRCVIVVEVTGRSSHGAEPQRGLSGLNEAAKIALNIGRIPLARHREFGSESVFVRGMQSGSTSLSVPEKAMLEIDMHLVPPNTSAEARRRIERYVNGLARSGILDRRTKTRVYVQRRKTPYLEPYITSSRNALVRKVLALSRKRAGRKVGLGYGKSVADENVFAHALNVPVLTIGPAGGEEHSQNEWVSKRSLHDLAELYSDIVEKV